MLTPNFNLDLTYIHGTLDGAIRADGNHTIIIYRIPRDFADNLQSELELKMPGIYFLTTGNTLYVGQADSRANGKGVLGRMVEPHSGNEIDKWDVGYALTSSTPTFLGATELNYLERFFYDKAVALQSKGKGLQNYRVLNGNRPRGGELTFSTRVVIDNFIKTAFFMLENHLGCKMFVEKPKVVIATSPKPAVDTSPKDPVKFTPSEVDTSLTDDDKVTQSKEDDKTLPPHLDSGLLLYCMSQKGANATGRLEANGGITVLARSVIAPMTEAFANSKQRALRDSLIADGTIVDDRFTVDHFFPLTSPAAAVIMGRSSSGNDTWMDSNGITLKRLKGLDSNE